jgi:transcription antitermination factor NusG
MNSKPLPNEYNWHAIYTFPRFEKKLNKNLHAKGIEAYLPLQKQLKKWKDRKKWVEEPIFRSYLFVKVSEREYYEALNMEGAVRYVSFSGKAVNIPETQIQAIQKLLDSNQEIVVSSKHFKAGEKVKIESGVLSGFEAEVVSYMGKRRILIRVEQIGSAVLVEVPVNDLG